MAKRYIFETRESKAKASEAYRNGFPVRVTVNIVNSNNIVQSEIGTVTFRPGDYETLTRGIIAKFGVKNAHNEIFVYAVGK